MNITLEVKPFEYAVEIPGYGLFYVRKLGAAAESDIMDKLQAIQDRQDMFREKYPDLLKKENATREKNDEKAMAALKETDEYKEAEKVQKEISEQLVELNNYQRKVQISLWRSDKAKAMERLMEDFSVEQIRQMYSQVMAQVEAGDK